MATVSPAAPRPSKPPRMVRTFSVSMCLLCCQNLLYRPDWLCCTLFNVVHFVHFSSWSTDELVFSGRDEVDSQDRVVSAARTQRHCSRLQSDLQRGDQSRKLRYRGRQSGTDEEGFLRVESVAKHVLHLHRGCHDEAGLGRGGRGQSAHHREQKYVHKKLLLRCDLSRREGDVSPAPFLFGSEKFLMCKMCACCALQGFRLRLDSRALGWLRSGLAG